MIDDADLQKYLDSASALIGVPIPPDHRAGVTGYFRLAAGLAAQIEAFELPPLEEPAPMFRPGNAS